jgi:hypothetical protein
MIEATEHTALDEEEGQHADPESDSLAPARGMVFASVLSAAIYCAAWLLLRD